MPPFVANLVVIYPSSGIGLSQSEGQFIGKTFVIGNAKQTQSVYMLIVDGESVAFQNHHPKAMVFDCYP